MNAVNWRTDSSPLQTGAYNASCSCGFDRTDITFLNNEARIVITYNAGSAHPDSQDWGSIPTSLLLTDNPKALEVVLSPFKVLSTASFTPSIGFNYSAILQC